MLVLIHLMLDYKEEKSIKRYLTNKYIFKPLISNVKEEIFITITALISATGHVITVGIYNCLLPLLNPYSLCCQ